MSKYTMQLREVINMTSRDTVVSWFMDYDLADYLTNNEIDTIKARGTWSKEKLANLIVDNYLMREIGFETIALFRQYVKITMKNIMESKLPLIYSASIEYDPLVNVDYTETYKRDTLNTGEASGRSVNETSGLSVNSDTPQGEISKENILRGDYASNTGAGETTATTTDSSNNKANTTENWERKMKGNAGISATAQKMIEQYRSNIRAINYEIIKELNSLFMGLY